MENIKEKQRRIKGIYGSRIPPAVCVLPTYHPCYGCVWYVRDTDVPFCPFHSCVKNKKGFMPTKKVDKSAD